MPNQIIIRWIKYACKTIKTMLCMFCLQYLEVWDVRGESRVNGPINGLIKFSGSPSFKGESHLKMKSKSVNWWCGKFMENYSPPKYDDVIEKDYTEEVL